MPYDLITYQTCDGRIPLETYLLSLRDRRAKLLIARRIQQASSGNLGDHHSLNGGLHEMRIDYGPGYRIYYGWHGKQLILLLVAGDKSTQQADISQARLFLADFRERNS